MCADTMGARPALLALLQVRVHEVDEVFGKLWGNLLFCAVDEMEANVGFKDLGHEAVDSAAHSGEEHELASAVFACVERTLDGVELAANFSETLKEFNFLAILVGHVGLLLFDNTYPGYGIYPEGV